MLALTKNICARYVKPYRALPIKIWFFLLTALINNMGVMINVFLALYLKFSLHYSLIQIGIVSSASGFGLLLGSILGGYVSDSMDLRRLMLFILASSSITIYGLAFAHSLLSISTLILLINILQGAFKPLISVVLLQLSKTQQHVQVMSLRRVVLNIGMAIANMIGAVLFTFSYQSIFYFDALITLLSFLSVLFFTKNLNLSKHLAPKGKTNKLAALSDKWFVLIYLCCLLPTIVFYQLFTVYPIYLTESYHLTVHQYTMLNCINAFMIIFLEVPLLYALRDIRRERIAALGAVFICFGQGMLPLGHGLFYAIALTLFWTLGEMVFFTIIILLAIEKSTERTKGQYIGIFQTIFSLAQMIAPLIGTWIYQNYSANLLWHLSAAIGIFTYFCFEGLHYYRFSIQSSIRKI